MIARRMFQGPGAMISRILSLSLAILVLQCGLLTVNCLAEEPKMHEGVLVSAGAGALVMKDAEGKQHSFKIDSTTKVTIHGKPGKIEELKAGMPIRVAVGVEQRLLAVSTIDDEKCPTRRAL